jgi:hypothetical protein
VVVVVGVVPFKEVLSDIVVVGVPSSVVVSSIGNDATAVGITEVKPRSGATSNSSDIVPVRLTLTLTLRTFTKA